ncbi:MAG TPA: hypothetical protein VEK38_00460 [Candidatus Bathyarchaeia archaeon]|nr:hypothetical protein [Candidatus Bathyarchaeia archaeon]
MTKQDFVSLLQAYKPSAEEELFKERKLAFVAEYANCFDRSLEIGHIPLPAGCLVRTKRKHY